MIGCFFYPIVHISGQSYATAGVSMSIEVKILLTRIEYFKVVAKPWRKPYFEIQH